MLYSADSVISAAVVFSVLIVAARIRVRRLFHRLCKLSVAFILITFLFALTAAPRSSFIPPRMSRKGLR